MSQRWVWKRPFLAAFLIDKCVSAFTVLISPMVLAVAIFLGYMPLVIGIPLWWMAGRSLKIFPYLRRRPQDFWMVPVYVLYSFIFGVIRIYALITINRQGWMTRGHATPKPPSAARKYAQSLFDGLATVGVITALLVGTIAYSLVLT